MNFNINSKLMDYLNTVVQFIGLNIIFIICCLPIITIGPAIAALYQVVLREVRGEHGYVIRKFFKHFKELFIESLLTSLLFFFIISILLFNVIFWTKLGGFIASIINVFLYILLVVVSSALIYVFPLIARFKNKLKQSIKNSFFIALTNPKSTFMLLLIHAVVVVIIMYYPPSKVFMLFTGFSFIAYCNSYILNKVFKTYEDSNAE